MLTDHAIQFGLEPGSESYSFAPSETARRLFLYRDTCGHFYTNSAYYIDRVSYDSILLIYMKAGSFFYCTQDSIVRVGADECAIFNTYEPHIYGTDETSEFLWLHIGGPGSGDLADEIIQRNAGHVFRSISAMQIRTLLLQMLQVCSEKIQIAETEISLLLYQTLYALLPDIGNENVLLISTDRCVLDAIVFIKNNYHRKISVKDIALSVHLSEAHFSRIFRAATGVSPYSYLKAYRIYSARRLLEQNFSISDTAAQTGWNSESNFIYAFRQSVGVSPGSYAKGDERVRRGIFEKNPPKPRSLRKES